MGRAESEGRVSARAAAWCPLGKCYAPLFGSGQMLEFVPGGIRAKPELRELVQGSDVAQGWAQRMPAQQGSGTWGLNSKVHGTAAAGLGEAKSKEDEEGSGGRAEAWAWRGVRVCGRGEQAVTVLLMRCCSSRVGMPSGRMLCAGLPAALGRGAAGREVGAWSWSLEQL